MVDVVRPVPAVVALGDLDPYVVAAGQVYVIDGDVPAVDGRVEGGGHAAGHHGMGVGVLFTERSSGAKSGGVGIHQRRFYFICNQFYA